MVTFVTNSAPRSAACSSSTCGRNRPWPCRRCRRAALPATRAPPRARGEGSRGWPLRRPQPQRGQLASQELGVGFRLLRPPPVLLEGDLVTVLLPVLRQQDQWRGVGGLGGERQVQQDERVGGVPLPAHREQIQADPNDDDDRLPGQVAPGTEKARDRFAEPADGLGVDVERQPSRRAGGVSRRWRADRSLMSSPLR